MKSNYEKMRPRHTFGEVIVNLDDQVLVRSLLLELVPESVKREIVRRFNERAAEINKEIEAFRAACEDKMRRPFTRSSDLWERFGGASVGPAADDACCSAKANEGTKAV